MVRFKPGVTFPDFVVTDYSKSRTKGLDPRPARDFRLGMVVWMGGLVVLLFLWMRLLSLQVFGHDRYKVLADENRLRMVNLPAPRGIIYDRTGKILAGNDKIFVNSGGMQVIGYKRTYPEKEAGAHVIGYLGETAGKELGLLTPFGEYHAGDMLGRQGLEAEYENKLRGVDGGWLIEVDSEGKMVRDMGKTPPTPGRDLRTSLSADLIEVAKEALGDKKGAIVVSDPRNGEIQALSSSPGFDPQILNQNFDILNTNPDLPLFNRAISGTYPPGSVFKMIVTTAAIDSGKVKPSFTIVDTGFIQIGTYRYSNWLFTKHGGVEGITGFVKGLTRSTDTFFYRLGEAVGPETIGKYAQNFGLGKATGIDIPGEGAGLVPSPVWKLENKNENWYLGNSFLFAIGQDDLLVTPLQINQMTNILATGGFKCKPHLIAGALDSKKCEKVDISQTVLDIVKKGMIGACSPGGTAFPLFDWNQAALVKGSVASFAKATEGLALPLIACKTGTAEYVAASGKTRTHGWLTAYAPADDPQISVTVLMEGGGEGSNVAAPAVRKILAKYFHVEDKYPYANIPQELGE